LIMHAWQEKIMHGGASYRSRTAATCAGDANWRGWAYVSCQLLRVHMRPQQRPSRRHGGAGTGASSAVARK
jgi:hypothetical protein